MCIRDRFVPRDGGLRARVVSRGAGEDFVSGGRGEQFGLEGEASEVDAVAHVQPVRAKIPRRRDVRARVGVLEDLRGAAREGRASDQRDEAAWERLIRCRAQRGRVVCPRG